MSKVRSYTSSPQWIRLENCTLLGIPTKKKTRQPLSSHSKLRGDVLPSQGKPPTTIGAKKLNFCVRHGNRCILLAIATTLFTWVIDSLKTGIEKFYFSESFWLSPRSISISPLHISLYFHFWPIYLIIFQGSYFLKEMGNLILRWASHLDAFSVYPFPT